MSIIGNALNQNLTNGQLSIGSTGAPAVASTLTAGTNISITNAAGSITVNSAVVPSQVLISSQTASSSSSIVFANFVSSSYSYYRLVFYNFKPATGSTNLLLTVSANGGSTYATTGYNGSILSFDSTATSVIGGSGANMELLDQVGNTENLSGAYNIFVLNTNAQIQVQGMGAARLASLKNQISMNDLTLASLNTIKLAMSSGNITAGVFQLYGISNVVLGSTGFIWNVITGTSQTMVANNGYVANNGSLVTFTLPASAAVGDTFQVSGVGAGGWKVAQNSGQTIQIEGFTTTSGTGGSLASTVKNDNVTIICTTTNTGFLVVNFSGNITYV